MLFKPNDWVQVKNFAEIATTLAQDGTLDGMPFMPEMLPFCGKQFKVLRRAEKTCMEVEGGAYVIREFKNNDVFFLDGLRCSGADHDGCQRACLLFWKSAWLKPIGINRDTGEAANGVGALRSKLKTRSGPRRYLCQSTQLPASTTSRSLGKMEILQKLSRDLHSGALDVREAVKLLVVPLYRKFRDRLVGRPRLRGTLK